jgi:hypothetical protein
MVAVLVQVVACGAEKDHGDNPADEGRKKCECAREGKEDRAHTVISGAAKAEEEAVWRKYE